MLDFMKKKKVTVRVPATSANIGPGFDSFACALSLYNTITFELCGSTLAFEGCDEAFRNRENLAYRGYELAMKKMGLSVEDGLKITIDADVPVCRGLGSSSTLIVAGAMAANELHDKKLSRMEILEVANEIEGHPDNVAAAIAGGLTASMLDDGKPYTVKYRMHEDIHTVVVIPDFQGCSIQSVTCGIAFARARTGRRGYDKGVAQRPPAPGLQKKADTGLCGERKVCS